MSKNRKPKHQCPIIWPIDGLETGIDGGDHIEVANRHFVQLEIDDLKYPVELNAFEAIKLGEALIEAGRKLDRR